MTADRVRSVLGEPGEVVRSPDGWMYGHQEGGFMWLYGTAGPGTFPAFGHVEFHADGTVFYTYGDEGAPPGRDIISQGELRKLLQAIYDYDRSTHSGTQQHDFDPLALIRVVNTLQPAGTKKALAALEEYYRVSGQHSHSVLFIFRILFDVPDDPGYLPPFIHGRDDREPLDRKRVPRYPMVLIYDVPLLMYSTIGEGSLITVSSEIYPPARKLLEETRKQRIKVRTKPLRPPDNPLDLLERFEQSPQWLYGGDYETHYGRMEAASDYGWERGRKMIMRQLLRLIRTAYPKGVDGEDESHFEPIDEAMWKRFKAEVAALNLRWDAAKNEYVPSAAPLPTAEGAGR